MTIPEIIMYIEGMLLLVAGGYIWILRSSNEQMRDGIWRLNRELYGEVDEHG